MLRMLIVDDERAIREALRIFLDWDSLGIEIIGLYKNGAEAFDAMLDDYPDIVLTDVMMPGLNGIELIARAHGAGMGTHFVILSGYAEFEFAKDFGSLHRCDIRNQHFGFDSFRSGSRFGWSRFGF